MASNFIENLCHRRRVSRFQWKAICGEMKLVKALLNALITFCSTVARKSTITRFNHSLNTAFQNSIQTFTFVYYLCSLKAQLSIESHLRMFYMTQHTWQFAIFWLWFSFDVISAICNSALTFFDAIEFEFTNEFVIILKEKLLKIFMKPFIKLV